MRPPRRDTPPTRPLSRAVGTQKAIPPAAIVAFCVALISLIAIISVVASPHGSAMSDGSTERSPRIALLAVPLIGGFSLGFLLIHFRDHPEQAAKFNRVFSTEAPSEIVLLNGICLPIATLAFAVCTYSLVMMALGQWRQSPLPFMALYVFLFSGTGVAVASVGTYGLDRKYAGMQLTAAAGLAFCLITLNILVLGEVWVGTALFTAASGGGLLWWAAQQRGTFHLDPLLYRSEEESEAGLFFQAGGTLKRDALCYVPRRADRDLWEALTANEFCYVLTARQMGKSSLLLRTADRLREKGATVVQLDLTSIGSNLKTDQWYGGLLIQIGEQTGYEKALQTAWARDRRLGAAQRFFSALTQTLLPSLNPDTPLVIFIDEIDVVNALDFPADEFFAGIRALYNQRTADPNLNRLTFCLSGVATPSDLIRDVKMTPFNIGRRIVMTDFTPAEAAPLAEAVCPARLGRGKDALTRILYWTDGHPYLTLRLCRAVAGLPAAIISPDAVDRICSDLFLSGRAREKDDNLIFVRDRLLRAVDSTDDPAALLTLYGRILAARGKRGLGAIADREGGNLVDSLRLSGVVKGQNGVLIPRCRIYERVFDQEWIVGNMPDGETRRLRAAYRRGVVTTTTGLGLPIVAFSVGGWIWGSIMNAVPTEVLPLRPLPARNAYDYFDTASKIFWSKGGSFPIDKENAAEEHSEELAVVADGIDLPYQAPWDRDRKHPFDERLRALTDLELKVMYEHLDKKDFSRAAADLLTAEKMIGKVANGSATRNDLTTAFNCEDTVSLAAAANIDKFPPDASEIIARKLNELASSQLRFPAAVDILKEEMRRSCLQVGRTRDWRHEITTNNPAPFNLPSNNPGSAIILWFTSLAGSYTTWCATYDAYSKAGVGNYNTSSPHVHDIAEQNHRSGDPFADDWATNVTLDEDSIANQDTIIRLLTAAFAIHAYAGQHRGAYPARLEDLVPHYLPTVPGDPYAPGAIDSPLPPLRYHRDGKGYTLYSIGPDGIDDPDPSVGSLLPAQIYGRRGNIYLNSDDREVQLRWNR